MATGVQFHRFTAAAALVPLVIWLLGEWLALQVQFYCQNEAPDIWLFHNQLP